MERWEKQEPTLKTCALITTGPNALMESIHTRMLAIVAAKYYDDWLDPSLHMIERLNALLRPFPPEGMEAYPLSPLVNNPRNDQPECARPFK